VSPTRRRPVEVYGAVVEGLSTVESIEQGTIEDSQTARPEKPVEILRTEIL
jgi:cyclophilin family peptidyl-prolyl cis-trans isomerase